MTSRLIVYFGGDETSPPIAPPFTRQRDHDRDLTSEQVLADQDPDPGLLLELEETDDQRPQLLGRSLEQLVLGEGSEELDDRLVVVRARDQILGCQDLLQLVVQQGGLGGRLHVRLRREQTDQPRLSGDPSVGRDLAHPHVVHPGSAMDGRVGLRLRDHEQIPVLDPLTDVRGKAVERRDVGERAPRDVGQDPEPGTLGRLDRPPLGEIEQVVLAIAQQDEVELEQPVEEVDGAAHLLGGVAAGGGSSEVHHVPGALLHRVEVSNHEVHVVQDLGDLPLQIGALGLAEAAFELVVHHGLAVRCVPTR